MTVDTKGVVVTPCKDVLLVSTLIEKALNRLVRRERDAMFPSKKLWAPEVREQFSETTVYLRPDSGMVQFSLLFRGTRRTLSVFFTCDGDHADLSPKSISMSMGCSGHSELIVKTALHALSFIGPAYYDRNDCDDVPLAPLDEYRPSLAQALALGYISTYSVDDLLTSQVDLKCQDADTRSVRAFLSALPKELSWKEQWDKLAEFVKAQETPSPKFLAEHFTQDEAVEPAL